MNKATKPQKWRWALGESRNASKPRAQIPSAKKSVDAWMTMAFTFFMNTHKRENADFTGKISIRLDGFKSASAALAYLKSVLHKDLANQLTENDVKKSAEHYELERIICQWGDPPYTSHCQGTGPCIPD